MNCSGRQVIHTTRYCSYKNDLFQVRHQELGQIALVTGAFSLLTVSDALHHSERVGDTHLLVIRASSCLY